MLSRCYSQHGLDGNGLYILLVWSRQDALENILGFRALLTVLYYTHKIISYGTL